MAPSDVVKRLGDTLALSGATLGLGALYGWWQTYSTVRDYGYISVGDALTCALGESAGCTLARVLCRDANPYCIGAYDAGTLWLGFLLMFAGTLMGGWRRAAGDPRSRRGAAADYADHRAHRSSPRKSRWSPRSPSPIRAIATIRTSSRYVDRSSPP